MPVATTPLTNNNKDFSLPWSRYLKALGDDLLLANNIINLPSNKNFKYTLNANICFCTYYNTTLLADTQIIILPYTAQLAFDVLGTVYAPATKQIDIPANTAYVHFWYVVTPSTN